MKDTEELNKGRCITTIQEEASGLESEMPEFIEKEFSDVVTKKNSREITRIQDGNS